MNARLAHTAVSAIIASKPSYFYPFLAPQDLQVLVSASDTKELSLISQV